jgi:hypothetical protein
MSPESAPGESAGKHEFIRVCSMLFAVGIIGLGIPVFTIMMRYNLMMAGMDGKIAVGWANVFPWAVSWMLYQGDYAEKMMDITGLTTNGAINFVAPLAVAVVVLRKYGPSSGGGAGGGGGGSGGAGAGSGGGGGGGSTAEESSSILGRMSVDDSGSDFTENVNVRAGAGGPGGELEEKLVGPFPPALEPYQGQIVVALLCLLTPMTIWGAVAQL